jgi:hypothetical protein
MSLEGVAHTMRSPSVPPQRRRGISAVIGVLIGLVVALLIASYLLQR